MFVSSFTLYSVNLEGTMKNLTCARTFEFIVLLKNIISLNLYWLILPYHVLVVHLLSSAMLFRAANTALYEYSPAIISSTYDQNPDQEGWLHMAV